MTERRPKGLAIPLSAGGGILATLFSAYAYLEAQFGELQTEIQSLEYRVRRVEERLETELRSGWSVQDQELWGARFGRLNPDVQVPEVRRHD